jgi:hypothetical protein
MGDADEEVVAATGSEKLFVKLIKTRSVRDRRRFVTNAVVSREVNQEGLKEMVNDSDF